MYLLQAHLTVAGVGGEGLGKRDNHLGEGRSRQDEVGGLNNRGNRSHGAKVGEESFFPLMKNSEPVIGRARTVARAP